MTKQSKTHTHTQSKHTINTLNHLTEMTGGNGGDPSNFGNEQSIRLKAKQTVHKDCTLVYKIISHWGYRLTILVLKCICNEIEQLSKWMADGRARFLTIRIQHYR